MKISGMNSTVEKTTWEGALEDYPLENYPDYEPDKSPRTEADPLWAKAPKFFLLRHTFESGGEFHIDMVFGAIDLRKAIIFPAQLEYETYKWLRSKRFELIEIPADEQRKYYPANLVLVEPGKVIMAKGAEETIRRVERAGVEVIPIETEGIQQGGVNGISCITGQLLRDPGPGLED